MSRQFTVESAARTCSRPFDCRRSCSLFSINAGLIPSGRVLVSRITYAGTRILGGSQCSEVRETEWAGMRSLRKKWTPRFLDMANSNRFFSLSLVECTLMQDGFAILIHLL